MRISAIGFAALTLLTELVRLSFLGGSVNWITETAVVVIGIHTLTIGRFHVLAVTVRIVLGLLLLGSVADRFGVLGGPGSEGVSWGSFPAFVDYTRTLLPELLRGFATAAGIAATILEVVLGIVLISGVAARTAAVGTAVLLTIFGVAMWTALGFTAMAEYAVPVLVAGAALLAVTADARVGGQAATVRHPAVSDPV